MAAYLNHQWEVNNDGLDSVEDSLPYEIDADRLLETTDRPDGIYYDWPLHMAEKNWVDMEAFIAAFAEALRFHADRLDGPPDRDMLERSFAKARRDAVRYQEAAS